MLLLSQGMLLLSQGMLLLSQGMLLLSQGMLFYLYRTRKYRLRTGAVVPRFAGGIVLLAVWKLVRILETQGLAQRTTCRLQAAPTCRLQTAGFYKTCRLQAADVPLSYSLLTLFLE
jgi:hypothetical protein